MDKQTDGWTDRRDRGRDGYGSGKRMTKIQKINKEVQRPTSV